MKNNSIKNKKNQSFQQKMSEMLKEKSSVTKENGLFNNMFFYIFLVIVGYVLITLFIDKEINKETVPISQVLQLINEEKISDIKVEVDTITATLKSDASKIVSRKEATVSFDEILTNNNIDRKKVSGTITVEQPLKLEEILSPLITFGLPLLIFYFIFKQMKGASGEVFSFGQSRAKRFNKANSKITFNDVAGNAEAKAELTEIVDFLKNPNKYRKVGARIPKGVLLLGSAGVGKTLLAKAVAGEADVPFFSVAGSEFMEMLVGVGSSRARDLFAKAKAAQPSLIFIDEIDAIGRQRGSGMGGGHDEREQTLNQILIEMDGFDERTNVIVLAATNRPDMLDAALVRPGRFDRRIQIPLPNILEREEIVKIHLRGKPVDATVIPEEIAKKTIGFSGADIENMLNEAAILAARHGKDIITHVEMEEASLKVTLGSERKTPQTKEDLQMTADHEIGHAIVSVFMPESDPVYRVSVVPRGGSLGHTSIRPDREITNQTKTRLLSIISMMLGGRAAEEILYGMPTVGAQSDLQRATEIAKKMVTEFGMSDLGPIYFSSENNFNPLLGDLGGKGALSERVASKIDEQIEKIILTCYQEAKDIIKKNKKKIEEIRKVLLEKETIDGDEFRMLLGIKPAVKNEKALENNPLEEVQVFNG